MQQRSCNFSIFGTVNTLMKQLKGVNIREKSLLAWIAARKLKVSKVALTLGNTIHLNNVSFTEFQNDQRWVNHEMVHIMQFKRYGYLKFIYMYLLESIKKGYYNNRFEVEARENEGV